MSTTTLTLTCHCHLNTLFYTPPPTTPLPLPSFYSHHPTHTTLLSSPLVLLTPIPTPPTLAAPGLSPTSPTTLKTTHLPKVNTSVTFCPTCGATFYLKTPSTYLLVAGCIETTNLRQWLKPEKHVGLESAVLPDLQTVWDDGLPRYADMAGTVEYKPAPNEEEAGAQDAGELEGSCGCGAVMFTIPRPPPGWEKSSPYKDWCKPGGKLCAAICFCDTCRLVSGAPAWVWMFTPCALIRFVGDSEDKLKCYLSSTSDSAKGWWVKRRFCGECGGSLFYESDNTVGVMWDVAMGALRGFGGRDGRKWLVWGPEEVEGGEEVEVDRYIQDWKLGKWSFEGDGEGWDEEMLRAARRGRGKWVGV